MLVFVARSVRCTALTVLFLPAFLLHRLAGRDTGPRLVRWYLQSCGAAFVKLGQLLSTRYDVLPAAYCDALATLLDDLPPAPIDRITAAIEEDLGRPLAACFLDFDPVPLASASVAQVHSARLLTGEAIVVKVIRPGIEESFRVDFFYFRWIARILERLGVLSSIDFREIVRELHKLSLEELDLRREARNLRQMHAMMEEDDIDHRAPQAYPGCSGRSVLTMERVVGVPVTKMIAAVEAGDEAALEAWALEGITPRRTARVLLRSLLEQTYRHRVFHVDPHAGNLFVVPGGALAWVDFGMIGWVDERIWAQQFKLRTAIATGKLHSAYQCLIATLEPLPPGKDLSRFEADIKGFLRDWTVASQHPGAPIAEKSSGYFLLRAFEAVRRAGLTLPSNVLRLYRSMIVSDMVMLKLNPQIDWALVIHDFVAEESERQVKLLATEATALPTLSAALRASVGLPHAAMDLVDWVQTRLPEFGRSYGEGLSRVEASAFLMVRYARGLFVSAWFVLIGAATIAPRLFPGSAWAALDPAVGRAFWPLMVFAAATMVFFQKLVGGFRRS